MGNPELSRKDAIQETARLASGLYLATNLNGISSFTETPKKVAPSSFIHNQRDLERFLESVRAEVITLEDYLEFHPLFLPVFDHVARSSRQPTPLDVLNKWEKLTGDGGPFNQLKAQFEAVDEVTGYNVYTDLTNTSDMGSAGMCDAVRAVRRYRRYPSSYEELGYYALAYSQGDRIMVNSTRDIAVMLHNKVPVIANVTKRGLGWYYGVQGISEDGIYVDDNGPRNNGITFHPWEEGLVKAAFVPDYYGETASKMPRDWFTSGRYTIRRPKFRLSGITPEIVDQRLAA
jgi:hypothetical protein